MRCISR